MSWNHRVFREQCPADGTWEYTIREVYYDENGKADGYADARPISEDSLEDLIATLGRMQVACAKPVLTEDDFAGKSDTGGGTK